MGRSNKRSARFGRPRWGWRSAILQTAIGQRRVALYARNLRSHGTATRPTERG